MRERNLPEPKDLRASIERLREQARWFRARLQEAYDRIAALERGARPTRRTCPRCGGRAFKMIPGLIEGAECLLCGSVFSLTRDLGDRQSNRRGDRAH